MDSFVEDLLCITEDPHREHTSSSSSGEERGENLILLGHIDTLII